MLAFDDLGSTNDEAMRRIRDGDPGEFWITATRQSGGRGRQGRTWTSPPGNLYTSLALRLDITPAIAPQLGFVAGVALAKVLRSRLGDDGALRIKWPNDMIFAGAKLAGLLLESTSLPGAAIGCVVGFGVNCRSHPDGLVYPATDLVAAGDPHAEPDGVLEALAVMMAEQLALWDLGRGFDAIRAAWLALAVDPGTRLAVTLPTSHATGTFQGLDTAGRLLLMSEGRLTRVDAGDVFLSEIADRV